MMMMIIIYSSLFTTSGSDNTQKWQRQESRAVAWKPRYVAENFERYGVCTQLFISFATFGGTVVMDAKIECNK